MKDDEGYQKIRTEIISTLYSAEGHVIEHKEVPAHSYVLGLIDLLSVQMQSSVSHTLKDTSGTDRAVTGHLNAFVCSAAVGNSGLGIVAGTGSAPVAIGNNALANPIIHGTGNGQLTYGAVSFVMPLTSGSTRQIDLVRTFINNSLASITVNEVGLVVQMGSTPWYLLIDRTLFTQVMPVGSTLVLQYRLSVTV